MQVSVHLFVVVFLIAAAGVSGRSLRRSGAGDGGALARAPGANDGIHALGVSFELENIDYFGLTDEWSDPNDWTALASTSSHAPQQPVQNVAAASNQVKPSVSNASERESPLNISGKKLAQNTAASSNQVKLSVSNASERKSPLNISGKNVSDALTDVEHWWDKNAKSGSHSISSTDKGARASSGSFLQGRVDVCRSDSDDYFDDLTKMSPPPTMMDAMRAGITNALERAIDCERKRITGSFTAFISKVISLETARTQGPQKLRPSVHVTFRPGKETPTLSFLAVQKMPEGPVMLNKPRASFLDVRSTRKSHWSTIADIIITDFPNNKLNDLKASKALLKKSFTTGGLHDSIMGSLFRVSGVMPDIRHLSVNSTIIKQWKADNMSACEKHLSKIVKAFTLQYTRAQVPMALYNECTNFMPKMSFSRDYILDHRDTHRCRKASAAFEKIWRYGKKTTPKDFELMCHSICEAKHGDGAPICHVTEGQKLAKAKK